MPRNNQNQTPTRRQFLTTPLPEAGSSRASGWFRAFSDISFPWIKFLTKPMVFAAKSARFAGRKQSYFNIGNNVFPAICPSHDRRRAQIVFRTGQQPAGAKNWWRPPVSRLNPSGHNAPDLLQMADCPHKRRRISRLDIDPAVKLFHHLTNHTVYLAQNRLAGSHQIKDFVRVGRSNRGMAFRIANPVSAAASTSAI